MTHFDGRATLVGCAFMGLAALTLIACADTNPVEVAPNDGVEPGPALFASPQAMPGTGRQIAMLDACEPESFNEAFGFEVCTPVNRRGGLPFSAFIAQLEKHQRAELWRFAPDVVHVPRTTTLRVPNLGGIVHSFTEVEEFGGGFIPLLNALSGNPDPAPECVHPDNPAAPNPDVRLILPGESDEITFEPGVEKKHMCCIHPWMRAVSK